MKELLAGWQATSFHGDYTAMPGQKAREKRMENSEGETPGPLESLA
jgi:hypothetical protein